MALDRGVRAEASEAIDELIEAAAADDHETSRDVKRLETRYDAQSRPELTLSINQLFQTTQTPLGGDTFTLAERLYSGTIDESYRIFADYRLATVILPEGRETDHHAGIGIDFTGYDAGASLELTEDLYPRTHIGGKATVSWAADDSWRLAADAQIFSDDTPLRALKHDITADSVSLRATYSASDLQTYTLSSELLTMSDGNFRASVDLSSHQRLLTTPTFTLDIVPELYTSGNTRTNAPYYNPSRDFEGAIGLDAVQILYRRYDFVYLHHLAFVPGYYWERGFSGLPVLTLIYEQRLKLSDDWSGAVGVRLAEHPYDGTQEDSVAVFANMDWRF